MYKNLLAIPLPSDAGLLRESLIQIRSVLSHAYNQFLSPDFYVSEIEARILNFCMAGCEVTQRKACIQKVYDHKRSIDKHTRNSFKAVLSKLRMRLLNSDFDVQISDGPNLDLTGTDIGRLQALNRPGLDKAEALKRIMEPYGFQVPNEIPALKKLIIEHMQLLRGDPDAINIPGLSLSSADKIIISTLLANNGRVVSWNELACALNPPYSKKPTLGHAAHANCSRLRKKLANIDVEILSCGMRGIYLKDADRNKLLAAMNSEPMPAETNRQSPASASPQPV